MDKTMTAQMLLHMMKGEDTLIPTARECAEQILKLQFEFLRHGKGQNWLKVQQLLTHEIHEDMEEWLRVQMFNLKQADNIKKEIEDG